MSSAFTYTLKPDLPDIALAAELPHDGTAAATASSSRGLSRCWPGWPGSRPGSRSATPAAPGAGTAAGRSPRPTRTPGPSCTSPARAGCASSRHRTALGDQGTATVPSYASGPSTGPGRRCPAVRLRPRPVLALGRVRARRAQALNRLTHWPAWCEPARAAAKSDAGLWLAIGIPVLVILLLTWPALIRLLTRRRRWLDGIRRCRAGPGRLARADRRPGRLRHAG